MIRLMACALVLTLPTVAASMPRQEPRQQGYDPYASAAIERADLGVAEQRLERMLVANGDDVSAMLNIAYIFGATGRDAGALYYYERVLAADNRRLEALDGGPVWSHDLARRGMDIAPAIAAR